MRVRRRFLSAVRHLLWWIGRVEPERAHHVVVTVLEWASLHPRTLPALQIVAGHTVEDDAQSREIMGLRFRSPVGLAAGFDKNGRCLPALEKLGFGFLEAGGVTVKPQAGNPRPRVQRFPPPGAIINALGFPNEGVEAISRRLARSVRPSVPVGWNLAKSRDTPAELAAGDFVAVMQGLWPHADYFPINVSSPNTPGLRRLEQANALETLLPPIIKARDERAARDRGRPLLLKISPDLDNGQLDAVVDVAAALGVDGIIATNSTLRRDGLPWRTEMGGGMSGAPLHRRSLEVVARVAARAGKHSGGPVVVGVGGIMSAPDAARMLAAGASLIQICTGLIFQGPELVEEINRYVRPRWLEAAPAQTSREPVAAAR
jgi:dihydroorotate dehydrogenase